MLMVILIKDIIKMEKKMDLEFISGKMEIKKPKKMKKKKMKKKKMKIMKKKKDKKKNQRKIKN